METTKLDRLIKSQIENLESKILDLNSQYDKVFKIAIYSKDTQTEHEAIKAMRMFQNAESEAKKMLCILLQYQKAKTDLSKIYSELILLQENL
jgi:hypothetical protein